MNDLSNQTGLNPDVCAQCKATSNTDCSICFVGIKKEMDKLKDRVKKLEDQK